MTTTRHAGFEALSAFVDGEAPEWADHVAGCPQCRATAAELRAMSAAVGAPPGPAPAAQRDAAIAAALDAGGTAVPATDRTAAPAAQAIPRHEAQVARLGRRREPGRLRRPQAPPRPWAMPAVAAVVVGLLGLSGLVLTSNRSTDESTAVAGAALDAKAESGVAGAPSAPVGDLGDVADAATLRSRAFGVTATAGATTERSTSSSAGASSTASATNSGNTGASLSSGVSPAGGAGGSATLNATPSASGSSAASIAPNAVGTRPCEERARAREAGLGPVTYFATARRGTTPAYVLGFASTTGPTVTLLMLAQDGCSELLRAAGP